jgi:hypothetical protein
MSLFEIEEYQSNKQRAISRLKRSIDIEDEKGNYCHVSHVSFEGSNMTNRSEKVCFDPKYTKNKIN